MTTRIYRYVEKSAGLKLMQRIAKARGEVIPTLSEYSYDAAMAQRRNSANGFGMPEYWKGDLAARRFLGGKEKRNISHISDTFNISDANKLQSKSRVGPATPAIDNTTLTGHQYKNYRLSTMMVDPGHLEHVRKSIQSRGVEGFNKVMQDKNPTSSIIEHKGELMVRKKLFPDTNKAQNPATSELWGKGENPMMRNPKFEQVAHNSYLQDRKVGKLIQYQTPPHIRDAEHRQRMLAQYGRSRRESGLDVVNHQSDTAREYGMINALKGHNVNAVAPRGKGIQRVHDADKGSEHLGFKAVKMDDSGPVPKPTTHTWFSPTPSVSAFFSPAHDSSYPLFSQSNNARVRNEFKKKT